MFWHDDWTGPLIDITGVLGPRVTGIAYSSTVAQATHQGSWLLPRGRHPITCLLRSTLPHLTSPLTSDQPDLFQWRNVVSHPPGIFSTSQTWLNLHPPTTSVPWHKSVWFSQRIPKHSFITWILARDRMPTRDRLRSWGIQVPSLCLLCNTAPESKEHLFYSCTFSRSVWESFFTHNSLTPPSTFGDIIIWVKKPSSLPKLNTICKLIFQATAYDIWKERNSRLHGSNTKTASQLIKDIQLTIRGRLVSLDRSDFATSSRRSNATSSSARNFSFLSTWFGFIQLSTYQTSF